ncbi:unnamed protein product, partial [Oppiella nova]
MPFDDCEEEGAFPYPNDRHKFVVCKRFSNGTKGGWELDIRECYTGHWNDTVKDCMEDLPKSTTPLPPIVPKRDHNDYTKNPHPIVCHFNSWSHYHRVDPFNVENIDYDLCTHINYGFAKLNETTYEIQMFDDWLDEHLENYERFVNLRKKNPNLTTMISIGGWNEGSEKYSNMVTNTEMRHKFVESVIIFLYKYGFDGINLDWQYPGNRGGSATDKENYIKLLEEFYEVFGTTGHLLTVSISPEKHIIDSAYDMPLLDSLVDWVNIMTYDYHRFDGYLGHNAPIYNRPDETEELSEELNIDYMTSSVNYTINYYLQLGLRKDKMVMGVPFYGRAWTIL